MATPPVTSKFDEATAILTGDALQARAFEIIAGDEALTTDQRLGIVRHLARAAGPTGMVGGQTIDLAAEDTEISAEALVDMHNRKTGALIAASVVCGAICANADSTRLAAMSEYGFALGLAFQVRDDILDEAGDAERLGKATGADKGKRKSTFVSTYGLEASMAELDRLRQRALNSLAPLGSSGKPLADMAEFIASRDH
ncbi:MAG: polyprenyl synthetase family protein [Gammaproteobacteria bacterium]|nr:polyprenyl synthetase family protein [Gammaproteobacteria bacterium]